MIYPAHFEEKIGFVKIRKILTDICQCCGGKKLVEDMTFSEDFSTLKYKLSLLDEMKTILLNDTNFPQQDYIDISEELHHLYIKGTFIELETLALLKSSTETILSILNYFKNNESLYPLNAANASVVNIEPSIKIKINQIIDNKQQVKDDASAELSVIRKSLKSRRTWVEKRMMQLHSLSAKEGWLPNDNELTIRNGRLVIPFIAAHKRKISGFVHDESSTGQTVYIEPAEIFEANNEIQEYLLAERREIIKILTIFTDFLRPYLPELKEAYTFLSCIDFVRAKAKFSISINAVMPFLVNEAYIDWHQAIHPLLYLSHKELKKKIIAQDIKLNEEERILIISGPNAGGKSVCLKMTGLLQYMLQCGLLIPVREDSKSGLFSNIFIEIGDEQSLESDLSTYSSHLINMNYFVRFADNKTLILIDEMGSGTEPLLGGAIAEAVLQNINEKKSYGIITTHYTNLKMMAASSNGIHNGAMLYDMANMKPTYQLSIGKPGRSFAFEIAKNIGMPENIISLATNLTQSSQIDYEEQLKILEQEKELILKQKENIEQADSFLFDLTQKYKALTQDIESRKKEIIQKAKEQALEIIDSSNKLIENTIRQIKQNDAQKDVVKELRETIRITKENIIKQDEKPAELPTNILPFPVILTVPLQTSDVKIGDTVKIKDTTEEGVVKKIEKDKVVLLVNGILLHTYLEKLEKTININSKNANKPSNRKLLANLNERYTNFISTIDLRGFRVEEALSMVNKHIDEAMMLNIKDFRILHGKGTGALRLAVRDLLSKNSEIESFNDEALQYGGHGITIVKLK